MSEFSREIRPVGSIYWRQCVTRNELPWLQRWASPRVCRVCQQAEAPGETMMYTLCWVQRPENQEEWRCPYPKGWESQEAGKDDALVQISKYETSTLPVWRLSENRNLSYLGSHTFLFCCQNQLIEQCPPTSGRIICSSRSTNLNVNFIQKYPHRNTQNNFFFQICGQPEAQ